MRLGQIAGIQAVVAISLLNWPAVNAAQEREEAAIIQRLDAAAQARHDNVLGFTVREHYAVYRGANETHPAAEMTVATTYRKGIGKSYSVLSESGSGVIRRFGLHPLLDEEKSINEPGTVEKSWFTSANYEMRLTPARRTVDGRECVAISIKPKRKAPNMIQGTLWVDTKDSSVAEVEGVASQRPSVFAGRTQMMRQYQNMSGIAMATHARAESNGFFGRTVVTIDYSEYKIEVRPAREGQ